MRISCQQFVKLRYTTTMTDYKKIIEEQLQKLTEELNTLGIHNPEAPEDWNATPQEVLKNEADGNIHADQVEDWNERRATLSVLETRYNNLLKALTKFDTGTFGLCEICNKKIEEDRLDANPAARTCKAHINDENLLMT